MSDFDRYMALHLSLGIEINHRRDGDTYHRDVTYGLLCSMCDVL
jgi:hypothetical protein